MRNIRVLIADDEPLMAEELKTMVLEACSRAEIVGICGDGDTALREIHLQKPDVAFLDIQMPGKTGLEVAAQLTGEIPLVVFATAYDDYALKAFQVDAVDYILKPLDENDVRRVMGKIQNICSSIHNRSKTSQEIITVPKTGSARKFSAEKGDRIEIIDCESIQLVYAKDRLVYIQTIDGQTYRSKLTLQEFENRLPEERFFRCHRNYVVNVDQIKQIASWFNRGYLLILKGSAEEIPVGRAYASKMKEYINL